MKEESIDGLFEKLNNVIVQDTILTLPNLSNKQLQELINALVIEAKKRKNKGTIWQQLST